MNLFTTLQNTIHDGTVDAELLVDPISKHFEDLGNKAGPSEFGSIFHSGSLYNGLNMRDLDKPLNPEAGESQQFPAFFFGAPEVLYVPHQSDPSPDLPCEIEVSFCNNQPLLTFFFYKFHHIYSVSHILLTPHLYL